MLLIDCPYCGSRPEIEFRYGGEAHLARDPANASDAAWIDYLYFRTNPRGRHVERWRHLHGCGRFFNAIRDTVSDRFEATYPVGGNPPEADSSAQADGTVAEALPR